MGGNFLLRPPNGDPPRALLHFLGGAFVGAAPHLTYNYLLSGLAEMGYLVVATPYPLGFDYLSVRWWLVLLSFAGVLAASWLSWGVRGSSPPCP